MGKKNKGISLAEPGTKILTVNKKARFDYEILEAHEAGLVLSGAEIKSLRTGNVNLSESYIRPRQGELFLVGAHISAYSHLSNKDYDPVRPRKLLMHKNEIMRLQGRVDQKGLTLVPLDIHLKRGLAKLQVGLARGKAAPDKRRTIQGRDQERELSRRIKYGE